MRAATANKGLLLVLALSLGRCTFAFGELDEPDAPLPRVSRLTLPYPQAHPGKHGIPLLVEVVNDGDAPLQLRELTVRVSREPWSVSWEASRLYPRELPAGRTTRVTLYLALASDVSGGELALNVTGFATGPDGEARTVREAPLPVVLLIGSPPDETPSDGDGDGLDDVIEAQLGTHVADRDSDGDGVGDGTEAALGVGYDSDGDGTLDALEDDSDAAGEPDLLEWRRGADPRDPADDLTYADLVVTGAGDELDGDPVTLADPADAGPTLSMREALTIAANRPGPDRISIDRTAVTTPITVSAAKASDAAVWAPITDADTFIDGGGARVQWLVNYVDDNQAKHLLLVEAARFTLRDLVIEARPEFIAGFVIVRGPPTTVQLDNLTVARVRLENGGPYGNGIIVNRTRDLYIYRLDVATEVQPYASGVYVTEGVRTTIAECTITAGGTGIGLMRTFPYDEGRDQLLRNLVSAPTGISFGAVVVDAIGNHLGPGNTGMVVGYVYGSHDSVVRDNVIHNTSVGLAVEWGVQRNRLSHNLLSDIADTAIRIYAGEPGFPPSQGGIAPPMITTVEVARVAGTHGGADGTLIEVFADVEDDAEIFLGSATLLGGVWELALAAPLPVGYGVTATATDLLGNTSALSARGEPSF